MERDDEVNVQIQSNVTSCCKASYNIVEVLAPSSVWDNRTECSCEEGPGVWCTLGHVYQSTHEKILIMKRNSHEINNYTDYPVMGL